MGLSFFSSSNSYEVDFKSDLNPNPYRFQVMATIMKNKYNMNQDQYQFEQDLKRRQEEHLQNLSNRQSNWRPCLHDQCPRCLGTGLSTDGICIHHISCPCTKCAPSC